MNIAIIGSSHINDDQIVVKAQELGKLLAIKGHAVVTGGVSGYPDVVAQSTILSGGWAVAYCAGKNLDDHAVYYQADLSKYSKLVFQNKYVGDGLSKIDLYLRSLQMCFDVDMAIVIGGRVGTMYEVTILAGIGKDIYIMRASGGVTDKTTKAFIEEGHKEKSKIEFFSNVKEIDL